MGFANARPVWKAFPQTVSLLQEATEAEVCQGKCLLLRREFGCEIIHHGQGLLHRAQVLTNFGDVVRFLTLVFSRARLLCVGWKTFVRPSPAFVGGCAMNPSA
jgi:hypothetical protein